ncbi:MAG: hypothetical protein KGP28_03280 [Bdellovibrionales bacterium]|nr:hypothetical protein [Bdellovibrionales bacterium]
MKLKFERFEVISCFSIRGVVELPQIRILAIGLETLVKTLDEPMVVNFTLATLDPLYLKPLTDLKKLLAKSTKHKVYWVGKGKGLSDFVSLSLLFQRLGGFKLRQIGERLTLEDETHELHARVENLKAELEKLGGDGDQAQKIVLENITLKEQHRMLTRMTKFIAERMKEQTRSTPSDPEYNQKVNTALEELKTAYAMEIKL